MDRFKKYLPFLFIIIVWFVFSRPYFLNGKVPFPSTYEVNRFAPWSSYENFWGPIKNEAMPDIITQIYPWRYFSIEQWKNGQVPLWNPYSFSGTPHLANYQSAALFPLNLIFFLIPFVDGWSILILLQSLLAALFMFLFARSLNRSVWGSLISSVSFMFCGFITSWMGYGTLAYAILFLPLSLFAIEKYLKSFKSIYLILLSISVPLSFFSGHFQTSLYFFAVVCLYIIYKLVLTKNISNTLYLILYIFFGLLLSLPQILPSIELYSNSVRSGLFLKGEVIPWAYLPTFIAPDFYGNPVTRNDWFGHYAEWNDYLGILPLMLGIYAILSIKKEKVIKSFFVFVSVISILLAFDTPFLDLLMKLHIPVISTSSASRIIVLFSFAVAVLSSFGFDDLVKDISNIKFKKIVLCLFMFLSFFAIVWGLVYFMAVGDYNQVVIARNNLKFPSAVFISSALTILSGSLLMLVGKKRYLANFVVSEKKLLIVFSLLLLIIVSFDMLRFSMKWLPFDPKDLVFAQTPVSSFISKTPTYYRFIGNFEAGMALYYKLPSVEGYDPLYIQRYGEFIDSAYDGNWREAERSVVHFPKKSEFTPQMIDLLGVRYVLHKKSDARAVWTFPFWTYPEGKFNIIFNDGEAYEVYENSNPMPRVFLASDYRVISDSKKTTDTLFDKDFDYRNIVLLEKDLNLKLKKLNVKDVRVNSYAPNNINIGTKSDYDAILVLTDNYYPGWKAFVDGKETEILRADYTFRSIFVPKGDHKIRFVYEPMSFKLGIYSAIVGLLGITLLGYAVNRNSKLKIKD